MKFEDLMGFIISISAFIFLIIRSVLKKNQVSDEEEEEELETPLPPPLPVFTKKSKIKTSSVKPPNYAKKHQSIATPYSESSIVSSRFAESAVYEVTGKSLPSRGHKLISHLKSKKNMVILKEIIGTPKGFR